jgi:ribonuclease HII
MIAFNRALIPSSPDTTFEFPIWSQGFDVAGIDEAGRGAWAGPVTAAAVILPHDSVLLKRLDGVRDSKQLKPAAREKFAAIIREVAFAWGVGTASNLEIDTLGIIASTRLAMLRAIKSLTLNADYLLLDAMFLPECVLPQVSLVKGDQRSLSIAAASILAKTSRDTWMVEISEQYGGYGFECHKGYGTKQHQRALADRGPCPLHRQSFNPIKSI